MIYPTLFIGLGTQGLKILEKLQLLVIEEYGEKPPIFEYIYFETDENNRPEVQSWAKNEIRMPQPAPVIRELRELQKEFDQGRHDYLKPWINESLLKHPEKAFVAGAGHIRMAGRLCFWVNWDSCVRTINSARDAVTAAANITSTINFLRDFYGRVGKQVKPGEQLLVNQPNVYLFGTLCGGTCGGTFIDIAYLIRQIFGIRGGGGTAKLKGIFTVLDNSILSQTSDDLEKKRAANCWASLIELDYFSHRNTEYRATWPNGVQVAISNPPFDYLYVISCSGNDSNLRLPDGKPDIDALNHMAAMVLFSETVSDLLTKKDAITINFIGHPRYNTPYCETEEGKRERSPLEDMPIFATAGLSAVWYPKYRIAEAAACHVAKRICQTWVGQIDSDTRQRIEKDAKSDWEEILRNSLPVLTHQPGGSIEDEISGWFDLERGKLLGKPLPDIIGILKKELEKFGEEKEHDCEISRPERLTEFENKLKGALRGKIITIINTTSNLAYAEYYRGRLDLEIKGTVQKLPKKYPRPEPAKQEGAISVDGWVKFVLRTKAVAQQKKEEFLSDFQESLKKCLIATRGFRAKPILENARQYLGVEIQPTMEGPKKVHPLESEIMDLNRTLTDGCIKELKDKIKKFSEEVVVSQNVQLIYESEQNSIEEDIRNLNAKLYNYFTDNRKIILHRIMSVKEDTQPKLMTLYEFIKSGNDKITEALITELRLRALEIIGRFNIAKKLLEREDPEVLRQFARRAEPHLELAGRLVEVAHPCFMVGNDEAGAPYLNRLRNEVLNTQAAATRIDFGLPTESQLIDHLLIFYKERGLLYKNENFATGNEYRKKYQEIVKNDPYGLFTHKGGEYEFDPRKKKREKEVTDLMEIITNLFFYKDDDGNWQKSSILQKAEAEKDLTLNLFKIERNELIIAFKAQDGSDVTLFPHGSGKVAAVPRLTRDVYAFELFRQEIEAIMGNIGDQGFIEQLNAFLARIDRTLERQQVPFMEIGEQKESRRIQFLQWKDMHLATAVRGRHGKI